MRSLLNKSIHWVARDWRRLRYEGDEMKDEKGAACSTHGGNEKCRHNFGRKSEGKKPLGRPRRRWEDNIRMDLEK